MDKIEVEVAMLKDTLKRNRDNHALVYKRVCEGYTIAAIKELEQKIAAVREGKRIETWLEEKHPVSYLHEYDIALDMMEYHAGTRVELSKKDFMQYVKDQWSWKQEFTSSNSKYL